MLTYDTPATSHDIGGGGYTVLPLSVRPSKIFFVTFFSATIDGKNLIFGHKLHIGIQNQNNFLGKKTI
jgi:hypothetical protein